MGCTGAKPSAADISHADAHVVAGGAAAHSAAGYRDFHPRRAAAVCHAHDGGLTADVNSHRGSGHALAHGGGDRFRDAHSHSRAGNCDAGAFYFRHGR
jgi:hypothetical protein